MDTKQTDVQSNTKNLNYSGTQAILSSLSFSHPPPRCRGFNPVMSVSGSLLGPCPGAAGSAPGVGGWNSRPRPKTRGGTARPVPSRPFPSRPVPSRRLPPPPLGRARGPEAALVLRHPRAHCTKTSQHRPEQPKGTDHPGGRISPRTRRERCRRPGHPPLPARSKARLQPCSQHSSTQHTPPQHTTQRRPSLPPNSRNSWAYHSHPQFLDITVHTKVTLNKAVGFQ